MPFFSAFLQAKIEKIKNKKIIGKIVHIVSEEKLWRPWRETNLIKLYKQGGKLMENNLMQELAAELNPREVNLKELNLQAESNDANENDAEGSVKKQPYVYRNAFEVTGKVISFNHDHMGHDMMTVLVKKQTPLFVRVIYDERMLSSDIVVGQHVHVKGYTKAFSYTDLAGKRTYMQFFSATSIEHRKTIMEDAFQLKGRFYENDDFKAYYAGTVVRAFETNDSWGQIILKVDGSYGGKKSNVIRMGYFKNGRLPEFDYKPGDNICVYTSVWTPKKEVDGKTVFYENLTVEDVVRISRAPEETNQATEDKAEDKVKEDAVKPSTESKGVAE